MSRSFLNKFTIFFEKFANINNHLSRSETLVLSILSLGVNTCYVYGTTQNKIIYIHKKYQFTRNGFTQFMIVDNNGNHYNVNNSLFYWKWDSIEDWNKMETSAEQNNKKVDIKYYGWRVPLLGLFPNIIMSDSSTSADCIKYKHYDSLIKVS